MMGSDTFIIVAFKCKDTINPSFLALVNSYSKYSLIAATFITAASITSPAYNFNPDFKT